jgi:hypothetical protein
MANLLWFAQKNQKTPDSGIPRESPSARLSIKGDFTKLCDKRDLELEMSINNALQI